MTDAVNTSVESSVKRIASLLQDSIDVKQRLLADKAMLSRIADVAQSCVEALQAKNKLLLAGNGGSASDAQHIAAELVGRFELERAGLPAMALTTNASQLTALSNDYGYEAVFSRQLQAFAKKGDVFFGLSTSGNSANIVAAAEVAKARGMIVIGMTGESGGKLDALCDICLKVPSDNTARIQEAHITIGHILCALIEGALVS
ncbi:MAG: D-sedoheptulose 7-phosphate isomerase [Ectothiorhodospiraceae bacterium]|nr:D-sedoheptulose 7-phosphate isomerase [Ectothiorhodospiraceae bacterium]